MKELRCALRRAKISTGLLSVPQARASFARAGAERGWCSSLRSGATSGGAGSVTGAQRGRAYSVGILQAMMVCAARATGCAWTPELQVSRGRGDDGSPPGRHRQLGHCYGCADRPGWGALVGSEVLGVVGWPPAPGGSAAGPVGGAGALLRPFEGVGCKGGRASVVLDRCRAVSHPDGPDTRVVASVWTSDAVRGEDPVQAEGLADRGQIRRAAGTRALLVRAHTLRPAVESPVRPTWGCAWAAAGEWTAGRRWRIPFWCWVRLGPVKARAS